MELPLMEIDYMNQNVGSTVVLVHWSEKGNRGRRYGQRRRKNRGSPQFFFGSAGWVIAVLREGGGWELASPAVSPCFSGSPSGARRLNTGGSDRSGRYHSWVPCGRDRAVVDVTGSAASAGVVMGLVTAVVGDGVLGGFLGVLNVLPLGGGEDGGFRARITNVFSKKIKEGFGRGV